MRIPPPQEARLEDSNNKPVPKWCEPRAAARGGVTSALRQTGNTAQFMGKHLWFKSDNQYTPNHIQLSLLTTGKQKLLVD